MEQNREKYFVNEGKDEIVTCGGKHFACYAIRTHVVTRKDTLEELATQYAQPLVRKGDVLFVSEKMLACVQGRAIPMERIRAGLWANILSRFVTRSPYGIGLAMPETMQCAIGECGLARILLAAGAGLCGRLLHKRGWFYRIAGSAAASIDGPCDYTLAPYNRYVVLGPRDAPGAAREISRAVGGNLVLIVDANDLGCSILGASEENADWAMFLRLLRQNPLGQGSERTPMGILRPIEGTDGKGAGDA